MKFIIISKKEDFNQSHINESRLSSCNAPSLISKYYVKKEMGNFDIYLYVYHQITEEKEGVFYHIGSDEIKFFNGFVASENNNEKISISEIFESIKNKEMLIGDYQLFSLNDKGNGFIKTPQCSIYPLFYYEDDYCSVVSNELKLIIDGVSSLNSSLVNYYNIDYLHENYHKGFFTHSRECIRCTAFKNIKRILPHDEIIIEDGLFLINENEDIVVPNWFEKWYLEDKDSLYDWYYKKLINYADSMLDNISENINKITLGLTGGFDSRLTVIILDKLCKKHNILLETYTTGSPNHPDVILAEKISQAMNLNWKNVPQSNKTHLKPLPQHLRDYASTFYESQGDFDSHDFVTLYSRKIKNSDYFNQLGLDIYKRDKLSLIINYNIWFSRRRLFKSNFHFPLFATNLECWFALIFKKHFPNQQKYTEFIYNVIKRGNPKLLEIPFAFESLPQVNIDEFKSEKYTTTLHDPEPFLWDYDFVLTELKPILEKSFDKKDQHFDLILSESGLNPLDYFILDRQIDEILKNYSSENFENVKMELVNLKNGSFYPKCRTYLKIDLKEKYYIEKRSLMILMDYASGANFNSFEAIGEYFTSDNYDSKEESYKTMDSILQNNLELTEKIEKLNNENKCLKKQINDLLSSNSWKLTKPLRKIKNIRK